MGDRGPKKTPTAVLKLRGSRRAAEREVNGEPVLRPEMPPEPEYLSELSKKHWHDFATLLSDHEIMTEIDGLALSMLCDAFVQYLRCRELVEKAGPIIKGSKGTAVKNPALIQMRGLWKEVMAALREFGMTPSSHSEILKAPDEDLDDKGRFFKVV